MQANCVEDKCSHGVPLTRSWTPPPVDHRYQLAIPTPPLQRPLRGGSWGRVRPFVQPTCRSSLGLGNDFKVVDRGKKKKHRKVFLLPGIHVQRISNDEYVELKQIISSSAAEGSDRSRFSRFCGWSQSGETSGYLRRVPVYPQVSRNKLLLMRCCRLCGPRFRSRWSDI